MYDYLYNDSKIYIPSSRNKDIDQIVDKVMANVSRTIHPKGLTIETLSNVWKVNVGTAEHML